MRAKVLLLAFSALTFTIFLLAYAGTIPTAYKAIPFYDEIGHFVLYGLWAYLAANVFHRTIVQIGSVAIPLGVGMTVLVAVLEESLQITSYNRVFSLSDMAWGIAGISIACILYNLFERSK